MTSRAVSLATLWLVLFFGTLAGALGLSLVNRHRWTLPLAAAVATAGVLVDLVTDRSDTPGLGDGL